MVDQDVILSQLVVKAKEGNEEAFKDIIKILDQDLRKIAKKYYIVGSDDQDVLQECRIGVWKAVRDFNEEGGSSFKNFALNLCCKRHLATAISHANTQKFKLQNEAVSLSAPVSNSEDDGVQSYADYIPDPLNDLEYNYIVKEEFETNLELAKSKFTKLEFSIFGQFAFNSSYKEIATALNIKPKSVDNTLLRVRKKSAEVYRFYAETHAVIGINSSAIGVCTGNLIDEIIDVKSLLGFVTSFCF
jgi:RNA polymerase sporulation-specific sigma factor